MVLLARKDEEGNTQALYDHLHGAGRLASGFEDEFADISRTAAVLHDVGKVAQQFQTYLLSDDGHRGDVQHARQGAFVVNDFFESKGEIEEIAKEILELAISKHHGGLPDCIDESGNRAFLLGFTESDKSNEKYAYQEIKRGLNGLALDLQSNFRGSAEDIACFLKKIKSLRLSKDSIYFYLGLLVKLIYSRLVDADRTDAACFETRKQYRPNAVDWQNLISRLDKNMRSFDSSSEINRIRHQINEQCCLAGARETGIYRLSIPTGGGKTLASLNFALHHALKTGKRRIIYVIPYLSITTQTAKTFRDVLGLNSDSDVLLEHYSTAGMQRSADVADNASSEFEDAGEHQRKLAAERWDNPIIVTTMVEFLETVMSARGTKLRKFHNMADSVIIFDEIQSLPMNTINLFNEIVSFLSKITNSTILLCSATQPLLEKTKRENLLLSEKPDLIAETESYEDKLRRTRIVASAENKSCDELGQIIYQQARKNGNCLAIVNLKKEAREIFQCLERLDVNHELVNNHGILTGNQAIVVWAIKRPEEKPVLNPQSGSFDFDDSFSSIADESKALHDDISDALNATNVQYAKIFSRVLRGYEGAEDLKKHNDPMVVVILDAATTGRLGVTFYCELQKDEYIKRILQWHVDAAWPLTSFKKSIVEGAERVNVVQYEGAPSFTDIINCACDTSDRSSKSYKRFAKDVKERLIECMFGGAQFPMSILNAACHKVTRPMGYDNIRVWRRDFEIACSLWKKHYIDETRKQHRQEDVITMYLEPNRDDRDYLYGRLLALADNFEESVLRKQGVKDRPTNAIKLMSNFTAKPYTTWGTLWKQLTPYLKSANGGSWFRNEVDDVMALFKEGDFEDNKALSPMFLLGYSCQRRASRRKAQEISQKNNSNN